MEATVEQQQQNSSINPRKLSATQREFYYLWKNEVNSKHYLNGYPDKWRNSYEKFKEDMYPTYFSGLKLQYISGDTYQWGLDAK